MSTLPACSSRIPPVHGCTHPNSGRPGRYGIRLTRGVKPASKTRAPFLSQAVTT